jgi:hypothetical protein
MLGFKPKRTNLHEKYDYPALDRQVRLDQLRNPRRHSVLCEVNGFQGRRAHKLLGSHLRFTFG